MIKWYSEENYIDDKGKIHVILVEVQYNESLYKNGYRIAKDYRIFDSTYKTDRKTGRDIYILNECIATKDDTTHYEYDLCNEIEENAIILSNIDNLGWIIEEGVNLYAIKRKAV